MIGSFYLLYHEFRGESVGAEVWAALKAISPRNYLLAGGCTLLAYAALAWYDRIALLHLGVKHISWPFISLCSFTTYALSHNIGASVFSGAMVRYRAYSTKGLTAAQVAVLVVLCSYTFGFGNVLLGGVLLTYDPELMQRLSGFLPDIFTHPHTARAVGLACLGVVALYIIGSLMHFKPFNGWPLRDYLSTTRSHGAAALRGSAGADRRCRHHLFRLPEAGNPGYLRRARAPSFCRSRPRWSRMRRAGLASSSFSS